MEEEEKKEEAEEEMRQAGREKSQHEEVWDLLDAPDFPHLVI